MIAKEASGQKQPAFVSQLETGLDFTTDAFSDAERESLIRWYEETHGEGDMQLNQFAHFLMKYDPGGFKRFRRNAIQLASPDPSGVGIPQLVFNLLFLNLYTVLHRERETLYEIISCKTLGLSKAETIDTIRFGFLVGGPAGINAVAERGLRYLDAWDDTAGRRTIDWPKGWVVGDGRLSAGLDPTSVDLTTEEKEKLKAWHLDLTGEVPRHVDILAKLHPTALKTSRVRIDKLFTVLPPQMAPLFLLHMAAYNVWPSVIRHAVLQARGLGVKRYHVLQTILSGSLVGGEWKVAAAIDAVADLLEVPWAGE